jgi:hypothetical protein
MWCIPTGTHTCTDSDDRHTYASCSYPHADPHTCANSYARSTDLERLAEAGIPHKLVRFSGGHGNHLRERIELYMLPFFSDILEPE